MALRIAAGNRPLLRAQKVVPTIRALRDHFGQVGAAEADKVIALLHKKELAPAERDAAIRRAIDLVIAKLLHHPQMALKADETEALAHAARHLFPLEVVAPHGAHGHDDHGDHGHAEPAPADAPAAISRPAAAR